MRNKKLELVLAKAKGETKLLKWIRVYIIQIQADSNVVGCHRGIALVRLLLESPSDGGIN